VILINVSKYGGDPERIFLSGHSAGGHIVSLMGVDPTFLQSVGLEPSIIKGVVSISGIYSIEKPFSKLDESPCCWKTTIFQRAYVYPNFGTEKLKWQEASPVFQVLSPNFDTRAPPFLLLNAQTDFGLDQGALRFMGVLNDQTQGEKATHSIIPGTHHGSVTANKKTAQLAVDFINKLSKQNSESQRNAN